MSDPAAPSSEQSAVRAEPLHVLSQLGIHGWEDIETPMLACVMLGEPFCMISEPGSAKTFFGQVLAAALELPYGYYDVSKALFEEIVGYPSPKSFNEGREEYIHTPLTIWDKGLIMVDEASRASRDNSNKFLEILGSRRLMGRPLPFKVAIGAMNPIEHQGTRPLDEAFADRFLLFIRLPQFTKMDAATRERILGGKTGLDAPSVGFWAGDDELAQDDPDRRDVVVDEAFTEAARQLRQLLGAAAHHYRALEASEFSEQVAKYTDLFAGALAKEGGHSLEPRRLKMIKRSVMAAVATRKAQYNLPADADLPEQELIDLAGTVAFMSMPHPYTAQGGVTDTQLLAAHGVAQAALKDDFFALELYQAQTWAEKMNFLLARRFKPTISEKVCADFLKDESVEADMTAYVVANLMLRPQLTDVLQASQIDKLAQRYIKTQKKLKQTTQIKLEITPDLAQRFEEYRKINALIEAANPLPLTRIACAYALGEGDGDPQAILRIYDQAREALIASMRTLQSLCVEWGVEGADSWEAPAEGEVPTSQSLILPSVEVEGDEDATEAIAALRDRLDGGEISQAAFEDGVGEVLRDAGQRAPVA